MTRHLLWIEVVLEQTKDFILYQIFITWHRINLLLRKMRHGRVTRKRSLVCILGIKVSNRSIRKVLVVLSALKTVLFWQLDYLIYRHALNLLLSESARWNYWWPTSALLVLGCVFIRSVTHRLSNWTILMESVIAEWIIEIAF